MPLLLGDDEVEALEAALSYVDGLPPSDSELQEQSESLALLILCSVRSNFRGTGPDAPGRFSTKMYFRLVPFDAILKITICIRTS
ncbi:hypothetical protein PR001_g6271 [Phytophthora rubi]|uniref:Uncharacterized protein n=1 Tax=Phytophthora rubi TaxID=129364 RepID=A0A6A3NA19_9STRA|nr:hypothetical protein PR002_g6029 [Phytophthora rubi]KAE9042244.1 hypothetical protein PR001_g6271 [Phytophthora rubi]